MPTWPYVVMALSAVNIWTVLSFWYDKQAAMKGDRRVSEANLLGLALIGGTPGAFLARSWFRHKTRKQPFSNWLILIGALQGGLLTGLLFAFA